MPGWDSLILTPSYLCNWVGPGHCHSIVHLYNDHQRSSVMVLAPLNTLCYFMIIFYSNYPPQTGYWRCVEALCARSTGLLVRLGFGWSSSVLCPDFRAAQDQVMVSSGLLNLSVLSFLEWRPGWCSWRVTQAINYRSPLLLGVPNKFYYYVFQKKVAVYVTKGY